MKNICRLNCSIGICAHNEEKNIGNLLDKLSNQKLVNAVICEIIVISSSYDRTNEIVLRYSSIDSRIRLIEQQKREGKASAVNLFIKYAKGDLLILESADTIPNDDTIEKLVMPLTNPAVGITGGHPVPINKTNNFIGFLVNFVWKLHHEISMHSNNTKCGELISFRKNLIKAIPNVTAVDETWIEAIIKNKGYNSSYANDAIVYNKGPENILDFIKQRRRISTGYLHLKRELGYAPSTLGTLLILKLIIKYNHSELNRIFWILGGIFLEFYSRLLGSYDFYIKKEIPYMWGMVESTKNLD